MIVVATKKKTTKLKYRMCLFVPVCLLLLMTIFATIGSYWLQITAKYQEKKQLEEQILALKEKAESLRVDVERLEDPDYVARYAREKYMYSKYGEIILRLPDDE